jgi:hypothetical protein
MITTGVWFLALFPIAVGEEVARAPRGERLLAEKSPYLRQHADTLVDWWPWGEAAFKEARRLN